MEWGDSKGAFDQAVKDGWNRIGGLGVEIVQKDDGSRLAGREHALSDGRAAGLGPIFGIDRPVGHAETEFGGDRSLLPAERTVRGAEPDWGDAGCTGDGLLGADELLFDRTIGQAG